ncbi:MAG: hypothetical protein KH415_22435 [Clostridium sp.]|nr:hypothetical protein [Clostridium sp.]
MALQKNRRYNNTDVGYWKVSGLNISYTGKVAQIYVIGFANEEERIEGIENKIAFENYICKGKDFEKYFAIDKLNSDGINPIVNSYNFLKDEIGLFIDSIDI